MTPGHLSEHLALWPGFNIPLALTVLAIAAGTSLFLLRGRIIESAHPRLGNADRAYDAALRAMDRLSLRITGTVQSGSLPASQAAILVTLIIVPIVALATGTRTGVTLRLWDSPQPCPVTPTTSTLARWLRSTMAASAVAIMMAPMASCSGRDLRSARRLRHSR